jgi:carbon-monoxide dehydrogenase iron sulfur subunit
MNIIINLDKCTGCRTCELICSFTHNNSINPRKARIYIYKNERNGIDTPIICLHCDEPQCAEACPNDAIVINPSLGIVEVNYENCARCGICADACINSAINIDPESKLPLICNLCYGNPKCVEWCPTDALIFNPTNKINKESLENAI